MSEDGKPSLVNYRIAKGTEGAQRGKRFGRTRAGSSNCHDRSVSLKSSPAESGWKCQTLADQLDVLHQQVIKHLSLQNYYHAMRIGGKTSSGI